MHFCNLWTLGQKCDPQIIRLQPWYNGAKKNLPLSTGKKIFCTFRTVNFLFFFFWPLQMALIKIMLSWVKSTYQTFHKWCVIQWSKKKVTDLGGANKSFPVIVRQFFSPTLYWYYSGAKKNLPLSIGKTYFTPYELLTFFFLITVEYVNFWHLREQYILEK